MSTNWQDATEVGARIVEQFCECLAVNLADAENDGSYDDLVAGYRDGRITLGVVEFGFNAPTGQLLPWD